ncbi:MAG TPA: PRC-barrel domain-containing protein [Candidatus Deferrimicrobium sp.]|nr:PRC-barrel domain-containing protein [Candidatus Deferrimicrobium sp.]
MAEETLAWRAIKHGSRVLDRDGAEIGTVSRVLADDGADIFHGVAVRHGLPIVGAEREIVAAQISRIDEDAVHTTLTAPEVEALHAPR